MLLTKNIIDKSLIGLDKTYLIDGLVMFIVIYIISIVAYNIISILNVTIEQKILIDLRSKVFRKILLKEFSFFMEKNVGEIIYRLINELSDIITFLINTCIKTIISLGNIIFFIIMLFLLDIEIASITVLFVLIFCIFLYITGRKFLRYEKKIITEFTETNNIITDILSNIKTILYMRIQNYSNKKFLEQLKKNRFIINNFTKFKVLLNTILTIISYLPMMVIWIYGGFKVINGLMTAGTLIALWGYYQQLMIHIESLKSFNSEYQRFKVNMNRLNEIVDFEKLDELQQDIKLNQINVENIVVSNVSFSYNGKCIISDFSEVFQKGDIVGIYGENGSGKSTLINIFSGFCKPDEGIIKINNIDISELKVHELKDILSIVPQDIQLFSTTVLDNICLDSKISIDEVLSLSNKIGFKGINEQFLNRVVLNKGANLSGGQKQKIAILRALIRNPSILILDEATSSLDFDSKEKFYAYINTIRDSIICFIISHEKESISLTKKIELKLNKEIGGDAL